MKAGPLTVVAIAVVAGGLGVLASLFVGGPGPLLGTEAGQRLYADTLSATAPAPPEGVSVPGRGDIVAAFETTGLDGAPLQLLAGADTVLLDQELHRRGLPA